MNNKINVQKSFQWKRLVLHNHDSLRLFEGKLELILCSILTLFPLQL